MGPQPATRLTHSPVRPLPERDAPATIAFECLWGASDDGEGAFAQRSQRRPLMARLGRYYVADTGVGGHSLMRRAFTLAVRKIS